MKINTLSDLPKGRQEEVQLSFYGLGAHVSARRNDIVGNPEDVRKILELVNGGVVSDLKLNGPKGQVEIGKKDVLLSVDGIATGSVARVEDLVNQDYLVGAENAAVDRAISRLYDYVLQRIRENGGQSGEFSIKLNDEALHFREGVKWPDSFLIRASGTLTKRFEYEERRAVEAKRIIVGIRGNDDNRVLHVEYLLSSKD